MARALLLFKAGWNAKDGNSSQKDWGCRQIQAGKRTSQSISVDKAMLKHLKATVGKPTKQEVHRWHMVKLQRSRATPKGLWHMQQLFPVSMESSDTSKKSSSLPL